MFVLDFLKSIFGPFPGLAGFLVLLAIAGFLKLDVTKLWCGADGRPSTSKFQFVIWNAIVIFVYVTYATVFFVHGKPFATEVCNQLPENILIVLGLSGATAIAAKGITSNQVASGEAMKRDAAAVNPAGGLITSDSGGADLSKLQMMAWTIVAVCISLVHLQEQLWSFSVATATSPACAIPDIDSTLMVLMGLSQGTYVGKKFVTTDTARFSSIDKSRGPAGTAITLRGAGFGAAQDGSRITIDGKETSLATTSWSDTEIKLTFPADLDGEPLAPGKHTISMIANGRNAANGPAFVLEPAVTGVSAAPTAAAATAGTATVTFTGSNFGTEGGSAVINGIASPVPAPNWTPAAVIVTLPQKNPANGQPWAQKDIVKIAVEVKGVRTAEQPVTLA